jgi:hypothetical protein
MATYGISEIAQHAALLDLAALRDGKQSGRGDFAVSAAVAEADLPPLHSRAQCPFHYMIGRLYSVMLQKRAMSCRRSSGCGFPRRSRKSPRNRCHSRNRRATTANASRQKRWDEGLRA